VRHESVRPSEAELRARLKALAERHPSWGSPRLTWLLRREGRAVNHKKVERLCSERRSRLDGRARALREQGCLWL